MTELARIRLAQLPTPLERAPRLTEAWGGPEIWVKRDDLTGFGLSGNKVRKIEYHFAAAIAAGHNTVITCGAEQSNHCRATALAAARVGLRCLLFLRTPRGQAPGDLSGNHLLQRLAGAECRFITPAEYDDRDRLMAEAAREMGGAWVIPEGASDALGAEGFVEAAREIATQIGDLDPPLTIWHPAMSAGTTAGLIRGAAQFGIDAAIVGCSVGDPATAIASRVEAILGGDVPAEVRWSITDAHVGGGYGVVSREELALQAEASRLSGLLFDPTYTGKALYGLWREIGAGTFGAGDRVIFWHTGGGFAAFAHDWSAVLTAR